MTRKDKLGLYYIAFFIIFIVGFIALLAFLEKKDSFDPDTLCLDNVSFNSEIVIIDKSDAWSLSDAQKITDFLSGRMKSLNKGEQLIITLLHDNHGEALSDIVYNRCNPGSEANPLYENQRMVLKKYQEDFQKPLDNIISLLTTPGTANNTPLLRAISESLEKSKGVSIKVFIVSDLLEYTDEHNFYKKVPSVEEVIQYWGFDKYPISAVNVKYIKRKKYRAITIARVKRFYRMLSERLGAVYYDRNFIYQ